MRELYDHMEAWQIEQRKRLLSVSVERDGESFCCIALTNPTEVVIVGGMGVSQAGVTAGHLNVFDFDR